MAVQRPFGYLALGGSIVLAVIAATQTGQAHKPITSKYTYNEDVFPIFRDRCARCHVAGGVAPMSLVTYRDAAPWAESLRIELMAAHMPPFHALQGFGPVKHAHSLTGRELDVLLVWAIGGTPEGDTSIALPAVALDNDWRLGRPDVELPLPEAFTPADRMEGTHEFLIPTGTVTDRWIRAVDLLPGNPAIVRRAEVSLRLAGHDAAAPRRSDAEQVLCAWLPGSDPVPTALGTAFRLPAGSELLVRIHYKKTWKYEGVAMTDRSTVGLYFADDPSPRAVHSLHIDAPDATAAAPDAKIVLREVLTSDVEAQALWAQIDQPGATLHVEAVRPDGARVPVIHLISRPNWARRYSFDPPLTLPRGTHIEASVTRGASEEDPHGAPVPAAPASRGGVRLTFDVVASQATNPTGR